MYVLLISENILPFCTAVMRVTAVELTAALEQYFFANVKIE